VAAEIAAASKLLELYPNFAFARRYPYLIETGKEFAEYVAHRAAAATGRTPSLFSGYWWTAGQIKCCAKLQSLTMAQAQLPNGVADIGHPRRGALFLIGPTGRYGRQDAAMKRNNSVVMNG